MKLKQMKIIGRSLAFLVALMCHSAMAGSDYYASLTTKLADGCGDMGQVYASTSGTEDASQYSEAGNGAVQSSSTSTSGGNVTMYAWAKANAGYEFLGWSTTKSGVTTYASTSTKYQLSLAASTTKNGVQPYTYYAYFRKLSLPAFAITFTAPPEGKSYTVNGAAPANLTGLTEVTTVTLATADSSFNSWKINGSRVDTNPYDLTCTADTTVVAEFLTPDKVATVTTKDELVAALANTNLLKVQIPSGTTITIPSGTTVTVPSGLNVVNDGQLLVFGTLTNNGKISGNGSYSINFYEITQGDVITPANSFTTYPAYRYCKTTVSKLSSTGAISGTAPGCVKKGAVRLAGSAVWAATTSLSPAAAVCSVNTSKGINVISSVDDAYDSIAAAFEAANPSHANPAPAGKIVVFFANGTLSLSNLTGQNSAWSSDGKQITGGLRVDCATYTFTISSKASTKIHIVNGTTIKQSSGDTAYNSWGQYYLVGCTGTATIRINANSGATSRVEFYDCANFGVSNNGSADLLSEGKGGGYYLYSGGPYGLSTTKNVRTIGGTYSADPTSQCLAGYEGRQMPGSSNYEVVKKDVAYSFFVDDESVAANQFATLAEAIAGANGQKVIKVAKALAFESDQAVDSKVVLDLNGFAVAGPGRFTVASTGDLTLIDTSATTTGTFAPALDISGRLSVAYGTYTGALTLKSGSTTATYAGTFSGAVTVNSGATASFRGGRFKTSLANYLATGYHQYSVDGCYCVGKDLGTRLTKKGGSSSLDEQYEVVPIGDSTLYSNYTASAPAFSVGSPSAYFTHAEAVAAISPLTSLFLDLVVRCDRTIAADTMSFKGTLKGFSKTATFPTEIPANADYRALNYYMTEVVDASLIKLGRFNDEVGTSLDAALYSDSSATANKGAVCVVELCLYGSGKIVLASSQFTLGARNNVAYVSRTGTYYSSLSGAVSAATAGDTVVLARESSASVTVSKALTIDTKGFALSGVTAGSGYELTQEGNVVTIAAPSGPVYISGASASASEIVLTSSKGSTASVKESSSPTSFDSSSASAASIVPSATGSVVRYFKVVEGNSLSENTLGLLRVDSKTKATIVAVPWEMLSATAGQNIPVTDIVMTTNLTAGDKLYAYDADAKAYAVWTLASGAWQPVQNYVTDASGNQVVVVTPDADNTNLPRGGAFWLVRQDATKPFYLYGQYTAAAATSTKITAGTTAAPVLQLLASPKTEAFAFNSIGWTGASANDAIILPSANENGPQTKLSFDATQGKWGIWKPTAGDNGRATNTFDTNITIPAGRGFWYMSCGGAPTVSWEVVQ